MKAKLTLVGAGPGDPELITLKGVKALSSADVILYDALVHPDLLEHAKPTAKKIYVGKRSGNHSYSQDEINQLIVDHALSDGHVVRLKGGDPFIFGRGKEEIEYAETFNIATEVVLGISSINLPGYYGIPLTRRGINESFWVVTATTSDGKLSKDAELVAQSSATGVFLMGLKKLKEITEVYQRHGKGNVYAAIISKGSLEDGKLLLGTVDTIYQLKQQTKVASPAIIAIGEAVGTHEYFYENIQNINEKLKVL
ncbi:uroporphyrinogen-III C-methyltransferase [Fulvivirgaceae bacterium BMA10]|uniref:uroporphyrinogen-III C-methyltransferase n=1 Tax=Splendidivirga corallicola TaxID=3051826 RepID=A0ABT8KX24_9BACT|nr:uroporphyrinogen-III C-methyltransferase [Fulvivirgaceae bacterium BMA10]